MAKKIELSDHEIRLIGKYRRGEFNQFTAKEETQREFSKIIDDARALCEEMNAWDDDKADDLVLWYYDQYKKQTGEE